MSVYGKETPFFHSRAICMHHSPKLDTYHAKKTRSRSHFCMFKSILIKMCVFCFAFFKKSSTKIWECFYTVNSNQICTILGFFGVLAVISQKNTFKPDFSHDICRSFLGVLFFQRRESRGTVYCLEISINCKVHCKSEKV